MAEIQSYIKNNFNSLLQLIRLDKLVPELKASEFNSLLIQINFMTEPNKKKEYILQHMSGVYCFDRFIQILLHTGHDALAYALNPIYLDMIEFTRCDPRFGYISMFSFGSKNDPDNLIIKKLKINMTNVYHFEKTPRGFCFLVNNYFTLGTFKEMQRFRNIFYQLHFDVIMEKNLDAIEIVRRLLLISKNRELANHEAFVFMIITQGSDNKEILGFDGERINIEILINLFDDENCPQLRNKPRMFFINSCRGLNAKEVIAHSINQQQTSLVKRRTLPIKNDFLICYSTLDGYVAQVDWNNGTFFGKALADSLIQKAWYKEINTILTNANNLLLNVLKEPPIEHPFEWKQCLTKHIYFFPDIPCVKEIKMSNQNDD